MSRIGKKPVPVGAAKVTVQDRLVRVEGPKGKLEQRIHPTINVRVDGEKKEIVVERPDDEKQSKALHGLTRSLLANMVEGVTNGYKKSLEIQGVGYKAEQRGKNIVLSVGYANQIAGSGGNDQIYGGASNDLLDGGSGADVMEGGEGDDYLSGGNGMQANSGNDVLIGGEDSDRATYESRTKAVIVRMGVAGASGNGDDGLAGLEAVVRFGGRDGVRAPDDRHDRCSRSGPERPLGDGGADRLLGEGLVETVFFDL